MSKSRDAWRGMRGAGRVMRGAWRVRRGATGACVVALLLAPPATLHAQREAQSTDTTAFYKALDLENAGKYKEAAPLFRSALGTTSAVSALLGLERVYAELGWTDSLLPPLDTLIRSNPRESVYRTVQLRTLQSLGRDDQLKAAVAAWELQVPGDPSPYREYARLLLQRGLTASADSVIRQARAALGSTNDFQLEIAQLRAAMGMWEESARAWRLALEKSPYLGQAAIYALAPTPVGTRNAVRQVLLADPVEVGARQILAGLEMSWGSAVDGWSALKDLPPDSASADAWTDFASRAEADERWPLARDALVDALRWRRTPDLAVRAATDALRAGDPASALALLPVDGPGSAVADSSHAARTTIPIQAQALAMAGHPAAAEQLIARYDQWLAPSTRTTLTRAVALGWVRTGDMARARASLATAGSEADSSDAAGWLALYDGNLKTARVLLRTSGESTPELATALAIIARIRSDSAPALGKAFLLLARNDSLGAANAFVEAAERESNSDATSILLSTAAQLESELHDDTQAIALWRRIVEQQSATPEAPSAELEWARALRRHGDNAGAVARLEHLILSYPQSALVPQARRELDLARSGIPGTT